jgi:hypothetical protein
VTVTVSSVLLMSLAAVCWPKAAEMAAAEVIPALDAPNAARESILPVIDPSKS